MSGGSPTVVDDSFAHGTRLVIPQSTIETLRLVPDREVYEGQKQLESLWPKVLADGPSYSRQYPVTFDFKFLNIISCPGPGDGTFELTSLNVQQDLDAVGGKLSIEPAGDGYLLTHNGSGRHRVEVSGNFTPAPLPADSPATPSPCPLLQENGGHVPITFSHTITIERAVAASIAFTPGCDVSPVVLSGRTLERPRVYLVNAAGDSFSPMNAADPPLEVVLETERVATIQEAKFGSAGILIEGAPQRVRLSTAFGELTTYQLASFDQIDAWKVEFWYSASDSVKSPHLPAVDGGSLVKASNSGFIGAKATVSVGGKAPCNLLQMDDFAVTTDDNLLCSPWLGAGGAGDPLPGFLAAMRGDARACSLEVRFPMANQGQGLSQKLSLTFTPPP